MTTRVAIVGFGKIARDQHLPAIAADPRFALTAIVSTHGHSEQAAPTFATMADMLQAMRDEVHAVAICTPPDVRPAIARQAIEAGLHVLLEKPPAATLGELDRMIGAASRAGTALFAAWHSQFAPAVPRAKELLASDGIANLRISWLEDVRKWHPGQEWIWAPGGFGVFDPGINALSIATAILPEPLLVQHARLSVPSNRQAPIAADITFHGDDRNAVFDWRYSDGERWDIRIETTAGHILDIAYGGARLAVNGAWQDLPAHGEYPALYDRFARAISSNEIAVDREPLRIVADAFLLARRETVEAFE